MTKAKAKTKTKTKTRANPRLPAEYVGLSVEEQIALLHEHSIRTEKNIDRLVQEGIRRDKEAKRRAEEADRRAEEADRRDRARAKEAERREKKAEREMAELRKDIKENGKQIGYVGNDKGNLLEERVVDAVWDAKEIGGIPIVDVLPDMQRGNPPCQYDLVCLNGKKTVVVEVKATLRVDDVVRFARERVPLFRRAFPEYARGKGVVGAMVYESADGNSAEKALEAGLILVRAEGKKELRHIQSAADLASKPARAKKRKAK